jgi:hypothetical protein
MTCLECELLLGGDKLGGGNDASVDDHLRGCVQCRALQEELRANALALSSLRDEELPRVRMTERRPAIPWFAAAAAGVLIALIAHQVSQRKPAVETHPRPRQLAAPATARVPPEPVAKLAARRYKPKPAPRGALSEQPLLVKMLTPDPDVVVYWLVD